LADTGARRKAKGPVAQRLKLVDEFIQLEEIIDNFKPQIFRHGKLRSLILEWYHELNADEQAIVAGTDHDIVISCRDRIRSVTIEGRQKLFQKWGQRKFIATAVVLLKSLPDPTDPLNLYSEQTLSGPRHLHVVAKGKEDSRGGLETTSAS
jgi:hypothetical protein